MQEVCKVVCKPVHYTKTVQVCSGRWETQVSEIPGPVVRKCVREPGCWTWDPCSGRCVYMPGKVRVCKVQCPPRKVCKKVWIPEVVEKTINCVRYERSVVKEQVPYTVCRYVTEKKTKTCTYKVCRMVKECKTKQIPYTVCRMVPECRKKIVTYKVCRMVKECKTKQIPYTVCSYEKRVCVKKVPYTVCKPVCYTKTIKVPRCVARKVPYTVTRCVPKVVCEQVPVTVCCPTPCGKQRRCGCRKCG